MDRNDSEQEMHSQSMILDDINYKQITNALAYQKDVEYMKKQLSSPIQVIQREVDDICDQLEYTGSIMFDEYPDKVYLGLLVDNIMLNLTATMENDEDGEVQGASIEFSQSKRKYCEDDAMLDCYGLDEDDNMVEATDLNENDSMVEASGLDKPNPIKNGFGWGHGPWGPPPPPPGPGPWGPPPPPGPWGPGPRCHGILCPIVNRRCGNGRWCSPTPFAAFDKNGNPNWMRHLVENVLVNEMNFRRSRYRNHNL